MALVVLGAGAWGTALAQLAATRGEHVVLWARDPAHADAIMRERENKRHLPDVPLAAGIEPISDIGCVADANLVLAIVPTQAFREVARAARPFARAGIPWVICAKGIERGSKKFLTDVLADELPDAIPAILSGPSFAADVARGLPTAVTVAAQEESIAQQIAQRLATSSFRLYRSTDIRGAGIGGAAKNVLAIACGIAKGAGLGASAGAWCTAGDADGPVRPRRFRAVLQLGTIAQLFLRACAWARRSGANRRAWSSRRRRLHRTGAG
jgi:glycerol-3-phosphate dehydrogenase (NAD(P)+)